MQLTIQLSSRATVAPAFAALTAWAVGVVAEGLGARASAGLGVLIGLLVWGGAWTLLTLAALTVPPRAAHWPQVGHTHRSRMGSGGTG